MTPCRALKVAGSTSLGRRGQVDRLGHRALGNGEGECAALSGCASGPDPPAEHLYELAADRKPKARPLVFPGHSTLPLLEAFEDPLGVFGRHADPSVANGDPQVGPLAFPRHPYASRLGDLDGVAEKVE